jgi:hypothetical protein
MGDSSTILRKLSPLALHIHFDDAFFDEENQVRKKTKKKEHNNKRFLYVE